jgi:cobalt/nickel transport system ATP-binding protein
MNQTESAIEIQELSFAYPDGRQALRQINLRVSPGERVALVGPNGAGKSTLLLHLNGLLKGQGRIRIQSLEVNEHDIRRVRALIGLVFQDPDDQLFSPTVFDDVAFGPIYMGLAPATIRERVNQSLSLVGMKDYGARTSHHLSVGEKKRAAIATVLAMEPPILALDEPSAGLDPQSRRQLINLLMSLPQTMLISSHDLNLVEELCPRTIVLDKGQIIADGDTRLLLHDHDLLASHHLCAD